MGSDASIYSMIRPPEKQAGPLDNYGSMMQLMAMGDTSQLNALHRQKLTGDLQEEDAFKSRIADWVKAGGQGQLPTDAYAASPTRAAAFDKTRMEGEKSRAELGKVNLEVEAAKAKDARDSLAGVTDQATYQQWQRYGAEKGYRVALQSPPQFDPAWRDNHLRDADKFTAHLESEKNRALTEKGQTETARHNLVTEGAAAAAANRDKLQIVTDTEGNITVVDKNTLLGRPAVDAEGNPLKGRQNMTESQGKAAGMAMRAREAQTILNDLEDKGVKTRGIIKQGMESIPLIGEGLAMGNNRLPGVLGGPSGPQQQVEQARRNFVNAVLRVESGASINESEFRNAEKQYFPMPGDSDTTVAQKKANRETAIRSLEMQAGPGKSKGNPMAPGGGSVMAGKGGIKFLGWEK